VASRSHNSPATEAYLDQFDVATRVSRGSSLKLCMVACGEADLYPRLAPTMEWDIAAGDAVLRAAGGSLSAPDGTAMRYGKPRFFNVGFVAAGDVVTPPIGSFLE
jgi:3'(2'), 5'-bisphosphate nucleotidase